jgi:hypothetical protein
MRVSCVANATEIDTPPPDLIVFPEYSELAEIEMARSRYPHSLIVAATESAGRSHGALWYSGQNRIEKYVKVGTDGRTTGSDDVLQQCPVYESGRMCVGVVICMDVQNATFLQAVVDTVKSSRCEFKFLCIPADMGSEWFSSEPLANQFSGVYVALCNNTKHPQPRCKSFMTNMNGIKIAPQNDVEPIHYLLRKGGDDPERSNAYRVSSGNAF